MCVADPVSVVLSCEPNGTINSRTQTEICACPNQILMNEASYCEEDLKLPLVESQNRITFEQINNITRSCSNLPSNENFCLLQKKVFLCKAESEGDSARLMDVASCTETCTLSNGCSSN